MARGSRRTILPSYIIFSNLDTEVNNTGILMPLGSEVFEDSLKYLSGPPKEDSDKENRHRACVFLPYYYRASNGNL